LDFLSVALAVAYEFANVPIALSVVRPFFDKYPRDNGFISETMAVETRRQLLFFGQ
jgi:hypothetical protein